MIEIQWEYGRNIIDIQWKYVVGDLELKNYTLQNKAKN